MRIGLLCFTSNGEAVANKIATIENIEFTIYDKATQNVKEFVKDCFLLDGIIFIGAVGIAVRLIAPYIKSKDTDPAVIVIDELGKYVIPILSGHIGGANKLAQTTADFLNATPIITTATDLNNVFAVDVWSTNSNCVIPDISKIKYISSALLKGEQVGFASDFECGDPLPDGVVKSDNFNIGIMVSLDEKKHPFDITLNVIPKIITIGVGCKKNTDAKVFEQYVLDTLQNLAISMKAVKEIASIDLKKEEECIIQFCNKYKIPFQTYTSDELSKVKGDFSYSEFVKKTTGVDNVCERSAVMKNGGELILKKQSNNGMTIAISTEKWGCKF
ncbi:cobalt-precorrin 5A hydrolase [Paludicola sp. MB14-C6]|uniref:cobalt-precorrin 5A hydrolase n=1 Tax=Paludihabitans sp. MB14-C6 TaxID=3070656 RepID=UPI0027DAFE69|nr:cobalt-precorrin 5A hydrolase [Paludicola sp. MB14-C6]WMJ22033.1 cobalt-precorrin 5A hydrolase [Paludicola sp. MB14-C6]